MQNASMTKISGGGLLAEYEYIIWPAFFWIAAVAIAIMSGRDFMTADFTLKFVKILIGIGWILVAIFFTWFDRKKAGYVLESVDGTFLCVKICSTEKNLPLSAIESVKIRNFGKLRNVLEVKVKRRSSSSDFSPGATFFFTPNENYELSALFRQFPIPGYYEYEH